MPYVELSDYSRIISKDDLVDLMEEAADGYASKSPANALDEAGKMAEGKMITILSGRYDTATEFAKLSTDVPDVRDITILVCYLHFAVYFLHFSINPRDIPKLRVKNFNECMKTIEKARDGEITLTLTINTTDQGRSSIDGTRKFVSKPFTDPNLFVE